MKKLLTVSALIEAVGGVGMTAAPRSGARLLVGSASGSPSELSVARIAGVAMLTLAVTCWRARRDVQAGRAVAGGMALYNAGAVAVLSYARAALGLSGVGLWPSVLTHAAMAAWCARALAREAVAPPAPDAAA